MLLTLAWIYPIFSAADLILTLIGLQMGFVEQNPIMAALVGTPWFIIIKIVLTAVCTALLVIMDRMTQAQDIPLSVRVITYSAILLSVGGQIYAVYNNAYLVLIQHWLGV